MYLVLSTPSTEYADAISHELWRLVRPNCAGNETSQFYTGRYEHPIVSEVCIGPLNGPQPIHRDADAYALAELIGPAVKEDEEAFITSSIQESKGGSLSIIDMIQSLPSLLPNLRTKEQLKAEGWFDNETE